MICWQRLPGAVEIKECKTAIIDQDKKFAMHCGSSPWILSEKRPCYLLQYYQLYVQIVERKEKGERRKKKKRIRKMR